MLLGPFLNTLSPIIFDNTAKTMTYNKNIEFITITRDKCRKKEKANSTHFFVKNPTSCN